MFDQVGWGEIAVLAIIALFVFGPEKLPQVASEAARMVRALRRMARDFSEDVRSELGPEFADLDLEDLNPKTFVRKRLLSDFDADDFRFDKYFDDDEPAAATTTQAGKVDLDKPVVDGGGQQTPRFDPDAT